MTSLVKQFFWIKQIMFHTFEGFRKIKFTQCEHYVSIVMVQGFYINCYINAQDLLEAGYDS